MHASIVNAGSEIGVCTGCLFFVGVRVYWSYAANETRCESNCNSKRAKRFAARDFARVCLMGGYKRNEPRFRHGTHVCDVVRTAISSCRLE